MEGGLLIKLTIYSIATQVISGSGVVELKRPKFEWEEKQSSPPTRGTTSVTSVRKCAELQNLMR